MCVYVCVAVIHSSEEITLGYQTQNSIVKTHSLCGRSPAPIRKLLSKPRPVQEAAV